MFGKLQLQLNKLNKSTGVCEASLPSLKRSISAESYTTLKQGLGVCREIKEYGLDCMMDFKAGPTDGDYDSMLENMSDVYKKVGENVEAISDAMAIHKVEKPHGPIKDEQALGCAQAWPMEGGNLQ